VTGLRDRLAASHGKFRSDALWNFASVGVLALAGLAITLAIPFRYDAAAFGVYNQVWAAYIVFSQAAVVGIDRSTLRALSERPGDRARVRAVIAGALAPAVTIAAAVAALFWGLREPLAAWLDSPGVAEGIEAATPGLFFFALNKVGLAVVNAAHRMRAFALYTSLRYAAMVAGLGVVIAAGLEPSRIAFLFTFAEGLLFLPLAFEVGRTLARAPGETPGAGWLDWSREHLRYGVKSVGSGMLLELNSRVDVLMLGRFLGDAQVGVYSFAAFVAEGAFQVLVALQNVYNPALAEHLGSRRVAELEALVAKGKRWTYGAFAIVAALALAGYPVLVAVLDKDEFAAGWAPLALILLGMTAVSGYMPFAQTLLMGNRPGWHTGMMASIVLVNVAGNAALIPWLGLEGAAAATGLCLVYSAFALRALVARQLAVRL
jgi:O-antigen/teichoic acid export membrane protein